jgi:hypothetical protein
VELVHRGEIIRRTYAYNYFDRFGIPLLMVSKENYLVYGEVVLAIPHLGTGLRSGRLVVVTSVAVAQRLLTSVAGGGRLGEEFVQQLVKGIFSRPPGRCRSVEIDR